MIQHRVSKLSKLIVSEGKVDLKTFVSTVRKSHLMETQRKEWIPA